MKGLILAALILGTTIIDSYRFAAAGGGSAPTFQDVATQVRVDVSASTTMTSTISTTLSNGYVVVDVNMWDPNDRTVTGVTYDGSAMTQLGAANRDNFGETRCYQFGLAVGSKAAAAYTVTVTMNTGTTGGEFVLAARTFNGVNQTTPVGTSATANGSSTVPSVVASSATNEVVVDAVTWGSGSATVDASQTQRYNVTDGGGQQDGAGSQEAGAASVTMSWTLSSSGVWCIVATPIKPL